MICAMHEAVQVKPRVYHRPRTARAHSSGETEWSAACCGLTAHGSQNRTKPEQNRNKTAQPGLQNQQNRCFLRKNGAVQLFSLRKVGFVGFAACAVRFCYGFDPVLSGSVSYGSSSCSMQAGLPLTLGLPRQTHIVNCSFRILQLHSSLVTSCVEGVAIATSKLMVEKRVHGKEKKVRICF